jgi:hypothetical protein
MPELHVEPQVLADAGRSLTTQRSVLADVAAALPRAFGTVAAALPDSRTVSTAGRTGAMLAAAVRAAAAEVAQLGGALSAAAREYTDVERSIVTAIERAGRRPA